MTKWQEVKLGDVCDVKGGKRLPKGVNLITIPNTHPYIRVRDLGQDKILQLKQNYEYVDDETQRTIAHYNLLEWHYDDVAFDADRYGKLIETFVFNELKAQIDLSYDYTLYQYRDRENREIDFIIEDSKGDMVGVEVKGGSRVSKDGFKHLKWFKENLAKDKKFIGIILYSGENTLSFGEDLLAVPTASLWYE